MGTGPGEPTEGPGEPAGRPGETGPQTPGVTETTQGPERGGRPTGVTVLGILGLLVGVLSVIGGIVFIAFGGAIAEMMSQAGGAPIPGPLAGAGIGLLGAVSLVFGVLYLAVGYAFLEGLEWGWILGLIVALLSLLNFPIGTVIGAVVIYYLFRPRVKRYFGKAEGTPV